jgi:hypothetical protein
MKNKFLYIQFIIIVGLFSQELKSQSEDKIYWFNLGISEAFTESNPTYINFGFSLNWKTNSFSHQVGLSATSGLFSGNNRKFTINYGIGHSFLIDKIAISFANIGPSLTLGTHKNYEDIKTKFFWATGISVNTQFYIAPLFFIIPEIAVGIEPYLNYNFYESARSNMRLIYGIRFGFNLNTNK